MAFSNITLELGTAIARLTLCRPEKLNSLDHATSREVRDALQLVQEDSAARVLILTGQGRAFCAGQDLTDPAMQSTEATVPDIGNVVSQNFNSLIAQLHALPVPTIAAVNGIAAGGGVGLALACDFTIATRSAYFLQAFSRIGLSPDTGNSWFLPQRIGPARSMALTMLAEKLSADTAQSWGLIWKAIADDSFKAGVEALAERLVSSPTHALIRTRQAILASATHTLEQQLLIESAYVRELGMQHDYREGLEAFREKRKPKFGGRR